jgi:hypothetical protein
MGVWHSLQAVGRRLEPRQNRSLKAVPQGAKRLLRVLVGAFLLLLADADFEVGGLGFLEGLVIVARYRIL